MYKRQLVMVAGGTAMQMEVTQQMAGRASMENGIISMSLAIWHHLVGLAFIM